MSLDPQIQDLKYSGQILKKLAPLQMKIPIKMKNILHRGKILYVFRDDARAVLRVFRVVQRQLFLLTICHTSNYFFPFFGLFTQGSKFLRS